jgi:mannosyl-oligosaccharide alpha-1,2-mannosidase
MTHDNKDILVPGSIRVMMTQNGKSRTLLESQVHQRACFAGGMFALGGALFNIPTHRKIATKLVDGCIWAAQSMPLGIMPEVYETVPCASQTDCPWNEWHWKQEVWKSVNASPEPDPDMDIDAYIRDHHLPKGFIAIPDTRYNLRPETIESMFNLYRVSAREDLLDTAWGMFESIQNTTEIINGNAALADVTTPTGEPVHLDSMESFWMSQTLKYFYLMFSAPDALSLDEYVFNSAGHPLKRPETEWIQ